MKLHKEYTYLFHDIDRHGVRKNHTSPMLLNDFTSLVRFKPDLDLIFELLEERKLKKQKLKFNQNTMVGMKL